MIESDKTFGIFTIYCDFCDESEDFDVDGFWSRFIEEAKKSGWTMTREENGEWTHKCPSCSSVKET